MIRLEATHGVFCARLIGKAASVGCVLAVRCDPWEAMRVATMKLREVQSRSRRASRNRALVKGWYSVPVAKRFRPDPYAYLNATDEQIGHIAHIEEGAQ